MPKKKNSTTKLDSLYDALKIPQEGKVPCLGHMKSNSRCATDRTHRRDNIESTLHDIIDALKDGDTKDSDGVQKLLLDLARRLTCRKKRHDHPVTRGSRDYDKYEYVAFVLGKRLGYWDEDADGETPESTSKRRPVPLFSLHDRLKQAGKRLVVPDFTISRHRQQAKSSDEEDEYSEHDDEDYDEDSDEDSDEDYNQESSEDEYEDEEWEDGDEDEEGDEEGDEEEDEGVTEVSAEESTMSRRQRPKPKREGPMIGHSAVVTPIKQRGRPSRNSRASTPRTGQVVSRFDSLSVIDDASTSSSESVISPGASEIFSPISTASTPMSIPDSEVCPRRSRYLRGEDESPTRRQRPSTGDAMRRMRDSLKKVGQLEKSLRLRNQALESERSTDDEEVEEQPTSKSKRASLPPLKVGNMRFAPASEDKENAVQLVLKRLRQAPMGKGLLPGWVYCFAEKTAPGYLKIGSKISKGSNGDTTLSLENQQNDAEVRKRLQEWERGCRHDIDYKFIVYMPCAVRTMERLVHLTLCRRNRKAYCPNPTCKTKTGHREWFEISEDEARGAVEVWEQFSNLMPYNDKGQLEKFWFDYATDKYKSFGGWPPEEWLYECWASLTGPAAVNHRKQISKLQKKETELTERRRQTEERKKELEHEIQSLKQEEKEIRQQLAQLQSQQ
ncbi:Hypothetical protein NCS54_00284600 [Fusarium falciforme]|uniref:Hypothetical protein n=1 Tax=Fusarium falciforme TaxID=195108 RepID=UPI0023013373|nr:Hypothetical protein NCS54_00284600 [Fusarium falciforme]WAO85599.1 Hypothetical protein NCS54_00284600 [Fusarium falciforme]